MLWEKLAKVSILKGNLEKEEMKKLINELYGGSLYLYKKDFAQFLKLNNPTPNELFQMKEKKEHRKRLLRIDKAYLMIKWGKLYGD